MGFVLVPRGVFGCGALSSPHVGGGSKPSLALQAGWRVCGAEDSMLE